MKKHVFFILFFIIGPNLFFAQKGKWIDMYSYAKTNQIIVSGDRVFGISENAFFTHDLTTEEIEKYSSIQGLSGKEIAQTYYDNLLKKFFIIYQNGLIQVIDEQKNITNIPDLYLNTFIPQNKKKCNAIAADQSTLFLAMDYGISEFDLNKNEFKDTYFIGNGGNQISVKDIALKDHFIYAASQEGLKKADRSDLLINFNNWLNIDAGYWKSLEIYGNFLLGIKDKKLYKIANDNSLSYIFQNNAEPVGLHANKLLVYITPNKLFLFNQNLINFQTISMPGGINTRFTDAIDHSNKIYAGTQNQGILIFDTNASGYTKLLPDGPAYNDPFGLDARDQQVWVVYGKHSPSFNPYPLLKRDVSHFDGEQWINIPYQMIQARSLCYVKINPSNPKEVYISSGHDGLIKIENDQNVIHYDETNSTLDYFVSNSDKNIRVFGMNYDEENNLYVTQTGTDQPIKILKSDGTWSELHFTPGFFNPNQHTNGIRALKIANSHLWAGTVYKGVLAYNLETGQYLGLKNGISPSSYPNIQSLVLDYGSRLWVGNHRMLRYLSNPDNVFQNPSLEFKPVKIEFEGSVQLLLEGESITKILVDGLNNKWIGTSGSGIYYVSEDAKKIISHFKSENSPLPSNEIYDIALDPSNGNVYFATAKGLLGYKSKAFPPEADLNDVYAFPNPVIMSKHQGVTIKGLIKGVYVKIIDVEGNLVYEEKSKGGSIYWDLSAFGKYKVASGVYLALITNDEGTKTQTTKILVIK